MDSSGRIRLAEGLAEILLAYKAVLDGFSKLSWVGTNSIVFKMLSWSPCRSVFISNNIVLLGVGNCSISLLESSAESFNSSTVVWYEIESLLNSSLLSSSSRLIA